MTTRMGNNSYDGSTLHVNNIVCTALDHVCHANAGRADYMVFFCFSDMH